MAVGMALVTAPAPATGVAPSPPQPDRPGTPVGLWLWPAALTLVLTLYRIGEPLLGRDELTSWDMAGRGTGQVLATARRVDAVVGTYYLVLLEWIRSSGTRRWPYGCPPRWP